MSRNLDYTNFKPLIEFFVALQAHSFKLDLSGTAVLSRKLSSVAGQFNFTPYRFYVLQGGGLNLRTGISWFTSSQSTNAE